MLENDIQVRLHNGRGEKEHSIKKALLVFRHHILEDGTILLGIPHWYAFENG
jgi:hypothetical protein